MTELSPEEEYFLQIMYPNLTQPAVQSPVSPQGQSPAITSPQRSMPPPLWRSSSPTDVTQASRMYLPDWGPPIAEDYEDAVTSTEPMSPRRARAFERFRRRQAQEAAFSHTAYSPYRTAPQEYSLDESSTQHNISDFYRDEPLEESSWNIRDRRDFRFDVEEDSLLRKFDRGVRAELGRRRRAYSTGMSGVRRASADSSEGRPRARSMTLSAQADNLAKAEALALFTEAVEAAEKAASSVSTPKNAEKEAVRAYEARLVEAVSGLGESGVTPVEVVAYVGVTRPHKPLPPRQW